MSEPALLFYDGTCGLCHRAVLFALRHDPEGRRFRFAPLEGATFETRLAREVRDSLPDSLVLLDDAGLHLRSEATLRVLEASGGGWRTLAGAGRLVPRSLRDALYDLVARVRRVFFRRPDDPCPVVPPGLRDRFLS